MWLCRCCDAHVYMYSPALVAPDANISVAARRIIWSKCLNSGQTCVAPDYVLCTRDKKEALVDGMKKAVVEFYGEVRLYQSGSSP